MSKHGLRVGITIGPAPEDADALLWASGVHQNAIFVAQLLSGLPNVARVSFVVCGGPAAGHPFAEIAGVGAMPPEACAPELDVLIELAARAEDEPMRRFRAAGGKLVSYMAGNVMVMNFEALANRTVYGDQVVEDWFDAVWITPQHWRMNRSYAALTRCGRVEKVPHIWSPVLLERSAQRLGAELAWDGPPPEGRWRIGIFDPNVNVVKTFHLPLLVCEEAFRRRPDLIDRVLMFGTEHLKGDPHFEEFCGATDLARQGKLFAEARAPLAGVLGRHIDLVVTHQWENELNYLYWDVLSTGRPLVHNVAAIAPSGYLYESFDPASGADALLAAMQDHRPDPEAIQLTLRRFSPDNPEVRLRHIALLDQLSAA